METPPQDAQSAFPRSTGLALTSLVLGIAAVGLSFVVIGVLFGLIGLVLGFLYLADKRGSKGMARWGIGLSIFGIFASIGFFVLYSYLFDRFKTTMAPVAGTTVTGAPANPSPLTNSSPLWHSNLVWSANVPGAQALCVGDWESDGSARVLVAGGQILHVLDLTGSEKSPLPLPDRFTAIECGRNKAAGARLLGYTPWGRRVSVIDHAGKTVWTESAFMGLNGAHWGDLNGDGNDEMLVGFNGFGGLEALSTDGKKLWSVSLANVWSQVIIPPSSNQPALVLATDASGSVNLFDKAGRRLNSLRAGSGYYAQMAAGVTGTNGVQILAFSGNTVEAFDQSGKAAWSTSALSTMGSPRACAVMGDFKGDGAKQWAFLDGAGDLVIATTDGLKVASIPKQGSIQGFAVAPRPGEGALLLTLDAGVVRAYSIGP